MSKVALSMILSGTEDPKVLEKCLASIAKWVDGIFITITTTSPNNALKEKAEEFGVKVDYQPDKFFAIIDKPKVDFVKKYFGYDPTFKDGDKIFLFDKARNYSMAQVTKDFEWIIWLDVDDIFRGGENLKEEIKLAEGRNAESVFFNYLYQVEIDENDNVKNILIEHLRERLIRNNGSYEWVAPIHETLVEKKPTIKYDSEGCDVVHLSDDFRREKALHRNLKSLEYSIYKTEGKDPRPIYYLGKAYFDFILHMNKPEYLQKAKKLFEIYLLGSKEHEYNNKSGWGEERSQCWEYLVEVYRRKGEYNNAIKCGHNALIEDERFPSIYLNIALCYLIKKEYARAMFWVKLASRIPMPKTTLVLNPKDLAGRALEIVYNASIQLNKLDEAWAAAVKLADLYKDNKEIQERLNWTQGLKQQKTLTQNIVDMVNYLNKSGEVAKIKPLMSALPDLVADNPIIADLKNKILPPKKWGDDEVTIFCGPGFSPWSPRTLKDASTFVGGSEEAVIYLAQELNKQGWKVTVYADPGTDEGNHDGVTYLPYFKFNNKDEFNIMVVWRQPAFVDNDLKTKKTYIWCHDIQNQLDYTPKRLDKITKIMVLSPWHRKNIPDVPDEKVLITSNGITL